MNESAKRRLEGLERAAERRKPALLTVTLSDGTIRQLEPTAAIDLVWGAEPGSLADVTANRPEYDALAGMLAAVFK